MQTHINSLPSSSRLHDISSTLLAIDRLLYSLSYVRPNLSLYYAGSRSFKMQFTLTFAAAAVLLASTGSARTFPLSMFMWLFLTS